MGKDSVRIDEVRKVTGGLQIEYTLFAAGAEPVEAGGFSIFFKDEKELRKFIREPFSERDLLRIILREWLHRNPALDDKMQMTRRRIVMENGQVALL